MSINTTILQGYLGKNAEISPFGKDNRQVVRFSVGHTERWLKKDGDVNNDADWSEKTTWVNVFSFNPHVVKKMQQHGTTGTHLLAQGKLASSSYEKNGETRYSLELQVGSASDIQVLPKKPKTDTAADAPPPPDDATDYGAHCSDTDADVDAAMVG